MKKLLLLLILYFFSTTGYSGADIAPPPGPPPSPAAPPPPGPPPPSASMPAPQGDSGGSSGGNAGSSGGSSGRIPANVLIYYNLCPDGSPKNKSISADGSFFSYDCKKQAPETKYIPIPRSILDAFN